MILSIETSGPSCAVALSRGDQPIRLLQVNEPQAHASQLALLIEQLFANAGLPMKALNAVAVSAGPGSYTGLRIGTSTAKGICLALQIRLIGISTLDLLTFEARRSVSDPGYFCPMIDARRMEVYCQVVDQALKTITPPGAQVIEPGSFAELLGAGRVFFFGDGSEKCRGVVQHEHAVFLDGIKPGARALGEMAFSKFLKGQFEDLTAFTPLYVKEFVAKKAQPFF